MRTKNIIYSITLILLISSCTTIYMGGGKRTALEAVESLNRGDFESPQSLSRIPFIFDGEIVASTSSLSKIWSGFVHAGFTVKDPQILEASPVVNDDFALFRSSWELQTYFKNKIPQYSYKVKIGGTNGEVLLLVNRIKGSSYRLFGLKAEAK